MINTFKGEYRWLSNFWPIAVELDGVYYPSVEHAYQASKTNNFADREKILLCQTPGQAKRYGACLVCREGFKGFKGSRIEIMKGLLVQKFENPYLRKQLLATGNTVLVEGNWWGDTFWGNCAGVGRNHLGELIMDIRGDIRAASGGGEIGIGLI